MATPSPGSRNSKRHPVLTGRTCHRRPACPVPDNVPRTSVKTTAATSNAGNLVPVRGRGTPCACISAPLIATGIGPLLGTASPHPLVETGVGPAHDAGVGLRQRRGTLMASFDDASIWAEPRSSRRSPQAGCPPRHDVRSGLQRYPVAMAGRPLPRRCRDAANLSRQRLAWRTEFRTRRAPGPPGPRLPRVPGRPPSHSRR